MANAFYTAEQAARVAASIVGQDLGLAGLVYRDLEADFQPGRGKTIDVRVPGAIEAQTRDVDDKSTPLVVGDLVEQTIPVTLSTHVYDLVTLSEGDLSLHLDDFASRVLRPQSTAIVRHVEQAVADAMGATPVTALTYDPAAPAKVFTQMRRQLRENGLPADAPLIAAVGSAVYADLLDGPVGTFAENGTVRGFRVEESTRVAPDEVVGFTPNAFALVVRAPAVPEGASFGASVSEGGFALRHLRQFNASVAADQSLVSALVACQAMPLPVDNEDGSVSLVPHGGAVRVDTTA